MEKKRVSIYDIAKRMNVSASTVSRALHDNPSISAELTKAIRAVAKEMNFKPNHMAVALKTGKANTIGMIVPQINRNFFVDAIAGAETEVYKSGYDLIICSSGNSYEREKKIISSLSQGKVVGVIAAVAAETRDYEHYQRMVDDGLPLVMFDRVMPITNSSSVTIDDYEGAYRATEHLIEQGCRKIYFFSGPTHVSMWGNRERGYLQAMKDHQIEVQKKWTHTALTTMEEGERYAKKLLNAKELPDGILFSGDFAARSAMEVFKSAGIRIPQDIAIVGFVNEDWDTLLNPPLSSIEQFSFRTGETAAKMIIEAIEGLPQKDIIYKPELIIRESSLKKDFVTLKK